MNIIGSAIEKFLERYDRPRLAAELSDFISAGERILDVGCGNGRPAQILMQKKNSVLIYGLEIILRKTCLIKTIRFDGWNFPFADKSFDGVMFIFVLHHCNPNMQERLLEEASRVSKSWVIIMEALSYPTIIGSLKIIFFGLLDMITNIPLGIPVPLKFRTRESWSCIMKNNGMHLVKEKSDKIMGVCKILKYMRQ